jgi:hypothetical protein
LDANRVQNFVRHKSGRYYARLFGNGKETWKTLKTDLLAIAKIKLRKEVTEMADIATATSTPDRDRMTVVDCA